MGVGLEGCRSPVRHNRVKRGEQQLKFGTKLSIE